MKKEAAFAVIVTSQIPVFVGWRKLALVNPHTAWRRQVKGTAAFFFFHSVLAWHTGLWGQAEIISFSLSFYTTSETHCTCANSQTHISKETFLLCLSRRFRKMLQKSSEGRLVQSETSKQYHCSSIVHSFTH